MSAGGTWATQVSRFGAQFIRDYAAAHGRALPEEYRRRDSAPESPGRAEAPQAKVTTGRTGRF